MGKCLTIVKLVGIGSLGLSSTAFFISAHYCVPTILKSKNDEIKAKITKLISNLRLSFWGLGSIATYLFYQAYTRSPSFGQHPYLIYAALTFPCALIYNYYGNFNTEQILINDENEKITYRKEKKIVEKVIQPEEETSPLDNSVYNDLGTREPKVEKVEIEVDVPVVEKETLSTDDFNTQIDLMNNGHIISGVIMGFGCLLSIIGYFGEP